MSTCDIDTETLRTNRLKIVLAEQNCKGKSILDTVVERFKENLTDEDKIKVKSAIKALYEINVGV
ncbi:MAG: hypothetical protein NC102_10685 [Clostridium sp.]|nr:hypothetical protein [Clostridium sp.]